MKDGQKSDNELIGQWHDGDEKAFDILYNRYRLQLYSYLGKLLPGRSAVVDDVYQQTWVRAIKRLPQYRERDKFLSWLFTIAHNLAIDHFRRESKRTHVLVDERIPSNDDPAWAGMDHDAVMQALESAIGELAPEQREVLLLRRQGVPFKEIADIQGTGINTVLGRMHYAVRKLQQLLQHVR